MPNGINTYTAKIGFFSSVFGGNFMWGYGILFRDLAVYAKGVFSGMNDVPSMSKDFENFYNNFY